MYIYTMKKNEALTKAKALLTSSGYKLIGGSIIAPDADGPLDAISIQAELSDIVYSENDSEFIFRLEHIGDKLKLIEVEL